MSNPTTINNLDVLKTVTANQTVVDAFSATMKAKSGYTYKTWPKAAGVAPSPEMLTTCVLFSKNRKCGPESMFVAMQLREGGASLAELALVMNCGPAHNHSRDDVSHNVAGVGPWYCTRTTGGGRFTLTFTVKGQKYVEKMLLAGTVPAEATNGAGAVKTKKATKAPVGKKSTSKPRKGNGKGNNLPVPPALVTAELNASTLAAVQAELAERNAELEPVPTVELVKPIDQPNA